MKFFKKIPVYYTYDASTGTMVFWLFSIGKRKIVSGTYVFDKNSGTISEKFGVKPSNFKNDWKKLFSSTFYRSRARKGNGDFFANGGDISGRMMRAVYNHMNRHLEHYAYSYAQNSVNNNPYVRMGSVNVWGHPKSPEDLIFIDSSTAQKLHKFTL